MIKTVFVPVSGSDTDTRVFETALAIARPCAAHLRFFHLQVPLSEATIRTPHAEFAIGSAVASVLESLRQRSETLSANALAHCHEFCEIHAVSMQTSPSSTDAVSASWTQETRDAMKGLMLHARHSDIVVLGRARNRDFMPIGMIESLLMGSGRPIVLAPEGSAPQSIKTVLVGWKETPEAARAGVDL